METRKVKLVLVGQKIMNVWIRRSKTTNPNIPHCYLTSLNLKKMGSLQFCLSIFLGIHRNPILKESFSSCEGLLMAALTGHGHPGPFQKIAKMALFNFCMKFEKFLGQTPLFEVLWKCHSVILSKICLRLRPSTYPSGQK